MKNLTSKKQVRNVVKEKEEIDRLEALIPVYEPEPITCMILPTPERPIPPANDSNVTSLKSVTFSFELPKMNDEIYDKLVLISKDLETLALLYVSQFWKSKDKTTVIDDFKPFDDMSLSIGNQRLLYNHMLYMRFYSPFMPGFSKPKVDFFNKTYNVDVSTFTPVLIINILRSVYDSKYKLPALDKFIVPTYVKQYKQSSKK
jgi:hypothetical protein